MDLEETLLPRVGVRYQLTTRAGEILAIVVQREGDPAGAPGGDGTGRRHDGDEDRDRLVRREAG